MVVAIKGAFVAKVGKFRLVTVGSLVHGSPYGGANEKSK